MKTLEADDRQKRTMNANVTPVVSALLLSITHYISTNICTVFKWQQLDIARKWTRCTFEGFLVLAFANYKHLVKSNNQQPYHHYFPLYPVLLFHKLYVLFKPITSYAVATKILCKANKSRCLFNSER